MVWYGVVDESQSLTSPMGSIEVPSNSIVSVSLCVYIYWFFMAWSDEGLNLSVSW